MSNQPARPDWPCGCDGEHVMTTRRARCLDCTEWCYPDALCVRGELHRLTAGVNAFLDADAAGEMGNRDKAIARLQRLVGR